MLTALRNRTVLFLWSGQILSSIGDEVYRVALMWLAVGLIGADTGYLGAAQSASLLILSLIGGKWADRWNPLKTMIGVDFLRAVIVLIPVVISFFMTPNLFILVVVAVSLSALGAFFDPALQASLPDLCPDTKTLQAANGVMSLTARLARVVGPGIVGLLSALVPIIHFFTLDSLSFFASAYSVGLVAKKYTNINPELFSKTPIGFRESLTSVFTLLQKSPRMKYIMFAKAVTTSTWTVAYSLGLALLINQSVGHDVKAFSLVIVSYGIGNVCGALIFANIQRNRPEWLMFVGYLWLGGGFLLIGFAPSLHWIMAASAVAAFGGPINDVAFVDLMQLRFTSKNIAKIFRFRMAMETAATLICMSLAPLLLKTTDVHFMIKLSGLAILAVGAYGLFTLEEDKSLRT